MQLYETVCSAAFERQWRGMSLAQGVSPGKNWSRMG